MNLAHAFVVAFDNVYVMFLSDESAYTITLLHYRNDEWALIVGFSLYLNQD